MVRVKHGGTQISINNVHYYWCPEVAIEEIVIKYPYQHSPIMTSLGILAMVGNTTTQMGAHMYVYRTYVSVTHHLVVGN